MSERSTAVDEKINEYAPAHQEIAEKLREMIHEVVPKIREDVKWGKPSFILNGSNLIYFSASKNHINLGFYDGASLPDPAGIVEGTGKKMRHVKLKEASMMNVEAIRGLIEAAAKQG